MNISGETIEALLQARNAEPRWANAYGEPGYDTPEKGIILANWNNVHKRVYSWLEAHGYALEWLDEWIEDDNGKTYRSSPDSHAWTPSFIIMNDCTVIGKDDLLTDMDSYIDYLKDNARRCDTMGVAWEEHGFERINKDSYESGWHPGQTDKPVDILAKARLESPDCEFIFTLDENSQFYSTFSIWKRAREE